MGTRKKSSVLSLMVPTVQRSRYAGIAFVAAMLVLVMFLTTAPTQASAVAATGLVVDESVARGVLQIKGVLPHHPSFQKWQLDLLLEGSAQQEIFLALGQELQTEGGLLAAVDTTHYPDGNHLLRLRIVDHSGNYSEQFTPIVFANVAVVESQRWIEVDLSEQTLTAWEGDTPILHTTVSTGRAATPTVRGRFQIGTKLPSQRMTGPGYDLPNVPSVMYFYAGYAIHGAYWHNNFGQPMSHGCVNMRPDEAAALYEWASIGTEIVVHE